MPISVLLVDDHELIRQGLRRSFERDGEFDVVGESGSVADAERRLILAPLDHFRGSKQKAAEVLGISLKTLYNRLSAYESES